MPPTRSRREGDDLCVCLRPPGTDPSMGCLRDWSYFQLMVCHYICWLWLLQLILAGLGRLKDTSLPGSQPLSTWITQCGPKMVRLSGGVEGGSHRSSSLGVNRRGLSGASSPSWCRESPTTELAGCGACPRSRPWLSPPQAISPSIDCRGHSPCQAPPSWSTSCRW